ncbi:Immunoglobulin superfamily member 10, partial [Orchesella cincta]
IYGTEDKGTFCDSTYMGSIKWGTCPNRSETNATTTTTTATFYNCPKSCQCEYSSSSQTLEISCSVAFQKNERSEDSRIDLSSGVRVLRISHAVLDAKSVSTLLPPPMGPTLVELDLQYVTIEPKSFFNSKFMSESTANLRKLRIASGNLRGSDYAETPADSLRDLFTPLASLKLMDSLNICDSSPSLATIVLQAMPAVNHLRAVNNSLYEIPYESLSHQYSIQSIDFSKNHIAIIPNGLLEGLSKLLTLDISQNRIFHLQEQVFNGLKSLQKLNVSHNRIEYVDAEVFTPLKAILTVDLSDNEVVQFFEPYFGNNKKLQILNMSNMWVTGTFSHSDTALRSLMETEQLINTLNRVEKLDLSANGMKTIPETLTHAPHLLQVYLDGNQWECSCQDRWFLDWVSTAKVTIGDSNSTDNMWCYSHKAGDIRRHPFHEYLKNLTRTCTNSNIIARTPYKFHAVMGKDKQLKVHAQKPNWPKITWITPSKQQISGNATQQFRTSEDGLEPRLSSDGSLYLTNVTGVDYGLYLCIASYEDLNITHYVHLGMDVSIFRDVRLVSILVGWTFSFAFLALVLLFQLVTCILEKFGIRCVTVSTTQQSRRVRAFFDSMDEHKNSQLDWLRDNYNMQAKKIKDNCYSQLERIRESYQNQSKNLGEIREYGTQQLHTLRDQYNDQVRKVAGYSAHQLCKVRENYVFKRNQVCKFSSHQLLRLRETYKWQAQTLNKILETLPRGLNFDTCRGMGACGRTESIYLDDMGEFSSTHEIEAELYNFRHGPKSGSDKLEHVSLLIPAEFVREYNKRVAIEGLEHEQPSTSSALMKEVEANAERLQETDTSTPSTVALECSAESSGTSSSYEKEEPVASTSRHRSTESSNQDV